MPLTSSKKYKISISQDNLKAVLDINGDSLPSDISEGEITKEITDLGIKITEQGKSALNNYIKSIKDGKRPEPIEIASGTLPVPDQNGYVKKLYQEPEKPEPAAVTEDGQPSDEGQSITCNTKGLEENPKPQTEANSQSHYEKSCFVFVQADQPLAELMPPVEGKDGQDVFGNPVPRAKGLEASIKLGKNVRFGDPKKKESPENPSIVYADIYGKLSHNSQKIWVEEDLEVHSDVDFSIGNIDFQNNVDIFRNVLDLFKVKAGKDITVRGIVEASQVEAEGNIFLKGGMAGKEKGLVKASQNIECKFITSSNIYCGGDLTMSKEVMYCNIECAGAIKSETGQLAGGQISAFKGISVYMLGSDAGTKTVLEVGMNEDLKTRAEKTMPEVKNLRMKAAKVREIVEPLLNNQKRLSNEQKEKATELLYETYELDSKAEELEKKLKDAYTNSLENSVLRVFVLGKIHPNVTIRFPRGESIITTEINGPVEIVPEMVNKITRLKATNTKTGISKILDYGKSYDEQWENIESFLGLR